MSIVVENLSARYRNVGSNVINNVSFRIEKGDIVGILGVAGSGKTTLLRCLNGLILKYFRGKLTGNVIVDGLNVKDYDIPVISTHIGLVLPDPALQIVSLTCTDDVAFGPSNLGLPPDEIERRVDEALTMVGLKGFERRTPLTLSGGEQQRLAIASILAMRPNIIAMDEPISMLDPLGKKQVLSVIKELNEKYGITIIISESGGDIEYILPYVKKVMLMRSGEILAFDSPQKIIGEMELFDKAGLKPPQITELCWKLAEKEPIPITFLIEEAKKYFTRRLKKGTNLSTKKNFKQDTKKEIIIKIRNLNHIYPGGVHALRDINLDIYDGEIVAIIGQNGSGKTTLSNHLIGVLKPSNPDAQIIVDGINVIKAPFNEIIKHINYVFQNPENQLFSETIEEEVAFGLKNLGFSKNEVIEKTEEVLKLFGIEKMKNAEIFWLPKNLKTYVAIASVIALKPKVLIVDEPTTGLDYASGLSVMKVLKELNRKGHTIIFITHNMKLVAEYATRVIVMKNGSILIDGSTREVFSKPEILREAFIEPPQITQLAQELIDYGIPSDVLTVDEMYEVLNSILTR